MPKLAAFAALACLLAATANAQADPGPTAPIQTAPPTLAPPAPAPPTSGPGSFAAWQATNPIGAELRSLKASGIALSLDYYTDSGGNPVGGVHHGVQNTGWIDTGADIDLDRLAGVPDTRIHLQGAYFYGESLAQRDIGNSLPVQQSWRPTKGLFLTQLNIEHDFLDKRLNVMVGRASLNSYFASSPLNCAFMTNVLCLTAYGPIANMGITGFPFTSWAAKVRYAITDKAYIQTGVFDYDTALSLPGKGGLDFSLGRGQGVMAPVELGYETTPANDRYPRRYRLGAYFNSNGGTSPYYDIRGGSAALSGLPHAAETDHRLALYGLVDQVVTPPDPVRHRNLTLLARFYLNAGTTQLADTFAVLGLVKTGTFPGRDKDTVGVLFTDARFSQQEIDFLRDVRARAGGVGEPNRNEFLGEVNYGFHPIPGLRFFPNIQYILHPDPIAAPSFRKDIPAALVVGVRMDILAGPLFGLPSR